MKNPFRTIYSHDRAISALFATVNNDPTMTQQSDAADADLNVIWKKYSPGQMVMGNAIQPLFGDFTQVGDFRDMQDRINAAKDAFQEIPAEIRKRFNQDPQEFIDFATNPENLEQLRKWKLAPDAAAPPSSTSSATANPPANATAAPPTGSTSNNASNTPANG